MLYQDSPMIYRMLYSKHYLRDVFCTEGHVIKLSFELLLFYFFYRLRKHKKKLIL